MEQCNLYAITSSTDDRCQGKSACVMKLNNCKEPPLPKANNHLIIQMSRVCRFTQRTYPGLSPISFLVLYAFSLFFHLITCINMENMQHLFIASTIISNIAYIIDYKGVLIVIVRQWKPLTRHLWDAEVHRIHHTMRMEHHQRS